MKLTDPELEAEFCRFETVDGHEYLSHEESLANAQGVDLVCPKCRGHHVLVAFKDRGVQDHQGTHDSEGKPTRWQIVSGTGLHDLTLSPSIDCTRTNPNCWHGWIDNGEIRFA